MNKKVGLIVGSLRKESFTRKVMENLKGLFPEGYEADFIEIGDLPFYNEDIDSGNPPQEYVTFREELDKYDAFVFGTPEYNRSMPAVLKNAIDVGSRPYGEGKWDGKPAGVISVTPGTSGAMGANHVLRQVFVFVNLIPMQQPEAYLSNITEYIDENGVLADKTKELLQGFVDAFVKHVERLS